MNWFAVFLYLYAIGIMAGIALVPWKLLGRSFFSVNTLIAAVLAIIATAVAQPLFHGIPRGTMDLMGQVMALGLLAITLVVTFVVRVSAKDLKAELFYLPVSMGAIFVAFLALQGAPGQPVHAAAYVLHYLATAALLGSTMVAMILGHWYLQDASLPFELLGRLAKFYLAAAVARLAASGLLVVILRPRIPDLLTDFDGVLVMVRVGAGIVASIVLALMVRSCVRLKSNQSATGILYVAVVFALIGEAMSVYLTLNRGLPL